MDQPQSPLVDRPSIGGMLYLLRLEAGFSTIVEAAQHMTEQGVPGVSKETLAAYEKGRRVPPSDKLFDIFRAYGYGIELVALQQDKRA